MNEQQMLRIEAALIEAAKADTWASTRERVRAALYMLQAEYVRAHGVAGIQANGVGARESEAKSYDPFNPIDGVISNKVPAVDAGAQDEREDFEAAMEKHGRMRPFTRWPSDDSYTDDRIERAREAWFDIDNSGSFESRMRAAIAAASAAPAEGRDVKAYLYQHKQSGKTTFVTPELSRDEFEGMNPEYAYVGALVLATAPTMSEEVRRVIEAARRVIGGGIARDISGNGTRVFMANASDADALSTALSEIEQIEHIDRAAAKGGSDV